MGLGFVLWRKERRYDFDEFDDFDRVVKMGLIEEEEEEEAAMAVEC